MSQAYVQEDYGELLCLSVDFRNGSLFVSCFSMWRHKPGWPQHSPAGGPAVPHNLR